MFYPVFNASELGFHMAWIWGVVVSIPFIYIMCSFYA